MLHFSKVFDHSKGSALLTALMVMTITAAAASAMMFRQSFDIRRAEQMITADRIYLYALGVELWAQQTLMMARQSLVQGEGEEPQEPVDTLYDVWAQPLEPTGVEQGYLTGQIYDQQGLFNINNLIFDLIEETEEQNIQENNLVENEQEQDNQEHYTDEHPSTENTETTLDEETRLLLEEQYSYAAILKRLLLMVFTDVHEDEINQMIVAIQDWINPQGEMNDLYLNAHPPYMPAHRSLSSISELRMIWGMTPERYLLIEPYVTALPVNNGPTLMNVNTLPPWLMQALIMSSTENQIQNLMEVSGEQGFLNTEQFFENLQLEAESQPLIQEALAEKISVNSDYFLVVSQAGLEPYALTLYSLLYRPEGGSEIVEVLWRSRNTR